VSVQAALESQGRGAADSEKRQAEFTRLVNEGKDALAAKKFADAVRAFEAAVLLVPGDAAALKGLGEAREGVAANEGEKKKLAAYKAHVEAARVALVAQRYADAIREFVAARQLFPDDAVAAKGQQQAEKLLNDLQDRDRRLAEFNRLVEQARTALAAKRYDDGIASLEAALRLDPNNPGVERALRDAKKARTEARTEYTRLMAAADAALQLRRFEEAYRGYSEAVKLFPADEPALRGQRLASRALEDIQAVQLAYNRYVTQGSLALQNQRYLDAVAAYSEALRLVPGDLIALQGLRDAQAGADLAAQKLLDRQRRRAELDRLIQVGTRALQRRKFTDAVQAFNDALRLDGDNPQALDGLRQAQYGQALADGRAALLAKRISDAIKNFEDALKAKPGDPVATNLLRQARAMKK
jgi:tetratricopeptide (TPR) repeat protein